MARFWRISSHHDLLGEGGLKAFGRWHSRGSRIVYLAGSPAGAMLEHLVHLQFRNGTLPKTYDLLDVKAPDAVAVLSLDPPNRIDWKVNLEFTQQLGDLWLDSRETPIARVPSVIMPRTWNFLLNPEHPDSEQVQISEVIRERFDNRLFHIGPR
jgi:RES domain-containing protein